MTSSRRFFRRILLFIRQGFERLLIALYPFLLLCRFLLGCYPFLFFSSFLPDPIFVLLLPTSSFVRPEGVFGILFPSRF